MKWKSFTGSAVHSALAIGADGIVYFGCRDSCLYALHPEDGSLKWKSAVARDILSSPAIGADGTIYIGSGDYRYSDNKFYAFNLDGSIKWSCPIGGGEFHSSSPAIGSDGTIYIGTFDGTTCALNPDDGSIKWSYQTGGSISNSPAIGADGTVYIGSHDGKLYAFEGPQDLVSITAPDPIASEAGLSTGVFKISRFGDTGKPLRVQYTITGTATSGKDYQKLKTFLVIPAGKSSGTILVKPKADKLKEGDETVILTLKIGTTVTAMVTITDDN